MEDEKRKHELRKAKSGSTRDTAPSEQGGSQARKAQEWGGGSKGSKGPITESDRRNPNSSEKS